MWKFGIYFFFSFIAFSIFSGIMDMIDKSKLDALPENERNIILAEREYKKVFDKASKENTFYCDGLAERSAIYNGADGGSSAKQMYDKNGNITKDMLIQGVLTAKNGFGAERNVGYTCVWKYDEEKKVFLYKSFDINK